MSTEDSVSSPVEYVVPDVSPVRLEVFHQQDKPLLLLGVQASSPLLLEDTDIQTISAVWAADSAVHI